MEHSSSVIYRVHSNPLNLEEITYEVRGNPQGVLCLFQDINVSLLKFALDPVYGGVTPCGVQYSVVLMYSLSLLMFYEL